MKKLIKLLQTRKPGVNEIHIKAAEEKLGALFPEEYKELFKMTNNPEIGDWILFPIKDTINLKKTWDDVVRQNQEQREEALLHNLIAIGENGTGDKLCFRIRKKFMQSQVYIWEHETAKTRVAALSLKEFIKDEANGEYKNETITLGTFQLTTDKIIVSDPCYPYDEEETEDLQVLLMPAKRGEWSVTVTYDEEEVVNHLVAFWGNTEPEGEWTRTDQVITVDSAQAGIFDFTFFNNDEKINTELENVYDIVMDEDVSKYYVACCDVVASEQQGGIVPGGSVAMSGYGDGLYEVYIKQDVSGEIVSVMIDFLGDEEDE
ncbi:SMI1/KNR4 family protein [Metabacillus rhizolycopersici]|uniref:SMI1/KNR4 family protein n=1 Tax=Metabacillus rhizolycopersici TaxID=2875709 RepID=A0ABS7UNR8_9BACI|nr:SMI1/KNR4 family protein [Metabacillus rhizolycopersici]MBZ5749948.1 SMI1/KNR4 family protein [Metabacillus rhizolycopersici]